VDICGGIVYVQFLATSTSSLVSQGRPTWLAASEYVDFNSLPEVRQKSSFIAVFIFQHHLFEGLSAGRGNETMRPVVTKAVHLE
jgi:hypothetical protein